MHAPVFFTDSISVSRSKGLRAGGVLWPEPGSARRRSNHQRHLEGAAMHEPPHTRLEEDLISCGEDEVGKLQLDYWPQPHDRRPDARADHDILRDRRIEDA